MQNPASQERSKWCWGSMVKFKDNIKKWHFKRLRNVGNHIRTYIFCWTNKQSVCVPLSPAVTVLVCHVLLLSSLFFFFFPPPSPLLLLLTLPALRSPISVPPGSYPAHFGVVSHAGLNGELASPGGFGGALTLSPQISAAASAYARSPMVSRVIF